MFTHITHEMYQGGCGIDLWIYQQDANYMKSHFAGRTNDHLRNIDILVNCFK